MSEILDRTLSQLSEIGVKPAESLGQHFLIDSNILGMMTDKIHLGSAVIEIGVGTGTITEAIAPKAASVVGVEIDKRFEPFLAQLKAAYPNTSFLLQDALAVNLARYIDPDNTQLIANLPFHIVEPFITKLIDLPIVDATLILGERTAEELTATPESSAYGRMSLLAQTFFSVTRDANIPRSSFYPQPRTDAELVTLTPKHTEELKTDRATAIIVQVFRDSPKRGPVVNSIKDALVQFNSVDTSRLADRREQHQRERSNIRRQLRNLVDEYNQTGEIKPSSSKGQQKVFSQEQALELISQMGIPETVLKQAFSSLTNSQLRELILGIRSVIHS